MTRAASPTNLLLALEPRKKRTDRKDNQQNESYIPIQSFLFRRSLIELDRIVKIVAAVASKSERSMRIRIVIHRIYYFVLVAL